MIHEMVDAVAYLDRHGIMLSIRKLADVIRGRQEELSQDVAAVKFERIRRAIAQFIAEGGPITDDPPQPREAQA